MIVNYLSGQHFNPRTLRKDNMDMIMIMYPMKTQTNTKKTATSSHNLIMFT